MPSLALPDLSRALLLAVLATTLLLGVVLVSASIASAGDVVAPVAEEMVSIDSDVGDGGSDGAGASEWLPFAMMLGPFIVLITGLLWVTFRIDKSEGREE